ncbi:Fic family protein [Silvibacterium bohemicum]|uniref:Fic family protein n=1 Tax=Silvibacterium bohemicum TaxID=1577686 RepID=A0A841JQM7_9BACT|nr:Fic family protein [Silvibacterium bohemicum]MBB6143692.1 Fic family protein [Silvibacterium bohemicum]
MSKTKRRGFAPLFTITPAVAKSLMQIEAVKQSIQTLPITPRVLAHLRETARLFSTHYSTMIEGNRLTQEEVGRVIVDDSHFPGRERDEAEVRGYYAALDEAERLAAQSEPVSERIVQKLHALVMGGGKTRVKPTPYRDGQNVIRDSRTKSIVYMPPEAKDVSKLMGELIHWIDQKDELPVPLKAAIAHYQFATIHPYYDGNGRTARLLTTLILHLGSYDLKGLYSLEEYYARNLKGYYDALAVGTSHNYYMGRADAEITQWVSYFIDGMAASFDRVHQQTRTEAESGAKDQSKVLRRLDPKQRKALVLFRNSMELTARDIAALFGYQARAAARLCQEWVEDGFIEMTNTAKKSRKYKLTPEYEAVIDEIRQ